MNRVREMRMERGIGRRKKGNYHWDIKESNKRRKKGREGGKEEEVRRERGGGERQ